MAMTCMRCGVAALLIFLYGRAKHLSLFRLSSAQIVGAISYFVMAASIAVAMKFTTAASAIALQYTAPVFVALLSATVLRERILTRDVLQMLVVIGGVFLCIDFAGCGTGSGEQTLLGNAAALLSGAAYAVFIVAGRIQKETPLGSILIGNLFGFFATLPWLVDMPRTGENLLLGSIFGLFCGGLGFILFAEAIRRIEALPAVLIASLDPVLNPVWVLLFIGEWPSVTVAIGAAIVIAAIFVGSLFDTLRPRHT